MLMFILGVILGSLVTCFIEYRKHKKYRAGKFIIDRVSDPGYPRYKVVFSVNPEEKLNYPYLVLNYEEGIIEEFMNKPQD